MLRVCNNDVVPYLRCVHDQHNEQTDNRIDEWEKEKDV